jgi:hypothetical protein
MHFCFDFHLKLNMVHWQGLLFWHQLASFGWKLGYYCWINLKVPCLILKHLTL